MAAWLTLVPVALDAEDDNPDPSPDPAVACIAVVVVVACDWIISRNAIALSWRMVAAVSTAAATKGSFQIGFKVGQSRVRKVSWEDRVKVGLGRVVLLGLQRGLGI